jgi:hypothetical protein
VGSDPFGQPFPGASRLPGSSSPKLAGIHETAVDELDAYTVTVARHQIPVSDQVAKELTTLGCFSELGDKLDNRRHIGRPGMRRRVGISERRQ